MKFKAKIMDEKAMNRSMKRLAHEIIEKNKGVEHVALFGILRRGLPIAHKIAAMIEEIEGIEVPVASLDITPYRDDMEQAEDFEVKANNISFSLKDKHVVLVDDVIFTGRSVRAAMDAVIAIGRPKTIQLAVLVDRGHRELPIRPDYVGKNVPTSNSEDIVVKVEAFDDVNEVVILEKE